MTAGFDLGVPSEHAMREGYAWAGITTQAVAVNGQPSLAPGFPATQGLLLGTDLEDLRQRGRKIAAGRW